MQRDAVHAVPTSASDLAIPMRFEAAIDGPPRRAAVIGAKAPAGRDGDEDALRIARSRMMVCRHMPPAPGCQRSPFRRPQRREFIPRRPAIGDLKRPASSTPRRRCPDRMSEGSKMPHALEFPRVLGAVVPFVRADFARVEESDCCGPLPKSSGVGTPEPSGVAHGFAAVVRPLDDLPKPPAGLRAKMRSGFTGEPFEVIHLPAREVRPVDFPGGALCRLR
jgi:hypothetical protein